MTEIVNLSTGLIHRLVFELRYDQGQVYWDRAGRIARDIEAKEGWQLEEMDGSRCRLMLRDRNIQFSFGSAKLDVLQQQSVEVTEVDDISIFSSLADELADIVVRILDLTTFQRIGFRMWTLFPTSTDDEANSLLQKLEFVSFDNAILNRLGQASEPSFRVVLERPDHMLRVAMAAFQQEINLPSSVLRAAKERARDKWKDQKKTLVRQLKAERTIKNFPQYGVLLDLDAYIEEPPYPTDLFASDFMINAAADFQKVKSLILKQRSS